MTPKPMNVIFSCPCMRVKIYVLGTFKDFVLNIRHHNFAEANLPREVFIPLGDKPVPGID